MSKARIGKKLSQETRLRMSLSRIGSKRTQETKIKMMKPKSEEHKHKLSEASTRYWQRKKLLLQNKVYEYKEPLIEQINIRGTI